MRFFNSWSHTLKFKLIDLLKIARREESNPFWMDGPTTESFEDFVPTFGAALIKILSLVILQR